MNSLIAPKKPIPRKIYLTFSFLSAAALALLWCGLSYGGVVSQDFLPTPTSVFQALLKHINNGKLFEHIWASASVVYSGFLLAIIVAIPVGVLMGSFQVVAAFVEPITNFIRYLPVSAMIPLLILWVGIGIEQKISVIFLGVVFNMTIMISDVSARISNSMLEAGFTMGANRRQVVGRILFPACLPGVMDALRVNMGVAWTYVVVAELVSSSRGLGFMILNAMRGLFTDVIFLGIVVIGLLGLISDQALKYAKRTLLPWASEGET